MEDIYLDKGGNRIIRLTLSLVIFCFYHHSGCDIFEAIMPRQGSTSHLSPTDDLFSDRPASSISADSETATFYSAYDFYPDVKKPKPNGENQAPKRKRPILNVIIPKSIREDLDYAAYNDTSPKINSSFPSPSKNPKRSLRSGSQRIARFSSRRAFSNTSVSSSELCQNYYYYQQQRKASISSPPTSSNQEFLYSDGQICSIQKSPLPHVQDNSSEFSSLPLPSTTHYWTSDSTRRLEYEAIDAASKGVRGFLIRLVPDCILPDQVRRTRFWRHDCQRGKKEGSVRRYRLSVPLQHEDGENKENEPKNIRGCIKEGNPKRSCRIKKWGTGLKSARN